MTIDHLNIEKKVFKYAGLILCVPYYLCTQLKDQNITLQITLYSNGFNNCLLCIVKYCNWRLILN